MALSNPFAIPGVGQGFIDAANKADAVISSTELEYFVEEPPAPRKVGTKVRTDKGWIYYAPETGFRGPFGDPA